MPCKIMVDRALKADILRLSDGTCAEIHRFLLALQENPLPESRKDLAAGAFYLQLPSGCFISWEILGEEGKRTLPDLGELLTIHASEHTLVRILGAAFANPDPR